LPDFDSRYNYTKECPGPSAAERRVCFTNLCRCFSDHLDFGTLSISYGNMWPNDNRSNVYGHMTPTTAVEIGEGFVIGLERTITKISGVYTAPESTAATGAAIYLYEQCMLKHKSVSTSDTVQLRLGSHEIAIIVWTK
jgi:hypothetical protein